MCPICGQQNNAAVAARGRWNFGVSVKLPVKSALLIVVEYKVIQSGHIIKCKCRKLELEGVPCSHLLLAKKYRLPCTAFSCPLRPHLLHDELQVDV